MVVTDEELSEAETTILSILRSTPAAVPPDRLMEELRHKGVSEYLARVAIWYLIDRDEVALTMNRRLASAGSASSATG